jgi:hypothetical protein
MRISILLIFLPVLALIAGLIDVGAGQDALNAWQGKYTGMTGFPHNPWLGANGVIVTFMVLSLPYLVLCGGAFAMVRYIRIAWLRWGMAELLILLSTLSFLVLMYYASVAWVHFRDVLIGPAPTNPLLITIMPPVAFVINTIMLIRSARIRMPSSDTDEA